MPKKDDPQARTKGIEIPVEPDLYDQVSAYAQKNKISVAALGRALLRWWTNRENPGPVPPGVEKEKRRPSRKKKDAE